MYIYMISLFSVLFKIHTTVAMHNYYCLQVAVRFDDTGIQWLDTRIWLVF